MKFPNSALTLTLLLTAGSAVAQHNHGAIGTGADSMAGMAGMNHAAKPSGQGRMRGMAGMHPGAAPMAGMPGMSPAHKHVGHAGGTGMAGMAGMEPAAMGGMAGMEGMAGMKPTPKGIERRMSGPAEAALQAFSDALEVGNRDLAVRWLAAGAEVVEDGVTSSGEAYASGRMGLDMQLRKDAKLVLVDRQVRTEDSGHTLVTSTIRLIGNRSDQPFDITLSEVATMKSTPNGWRVQRVEWRPAPNAAAA